MSIKGYILITLVVIVVILALAFLISFKLGMIPTQGKRISKYNNPKKALLVIDVQEDYTGPKAEKPFPYKDAGEKIDTINKLISNASNSDMKVLYIKQEFDNNLITRNFVRAAIKGQQGVEIDSRIKLVNKNIFTKIRADAFSNPQLDEFLIKNQVNEVYLVGLDAAYCVNATALGALNRGYKVNMVKDGIMTRKNMAEILKSYEKAGLILTSSKELLEERN